VDLAKDPVRRRSSARIFSKIHYHTENELMPMYIYEVIEEDGSGGERIEVVQPMSAPPLEAHPETGKPVRRVFMPPHIAGGKWSDRAMVNSATDDNKLDRLGFTKYVKSDTGKYEKAVGSGPDIISAD
jgi:predicted nucleic acid-binding Zn ribbon protein